MSSVFSDDSVETPPPFIATRYYARPMVEGFVVPTAPTVMWSYNTYLDEPEPEPAYVIEREPSYLVTDTLEPEKRSEDGDEWYYSMPNKEIIIPRPQT